MFLRPFFALLLLLSLGACFSHDKSYITGGGVLRELPRTFMLAGDDRSTGFILEQNGDHYLMQGEADTPVKIRKLPGMPGVLLAEMRSDKDGKVSYSTGIFRSTGSKRYEQIMEMGAVTSAAEINRKTREALSKDDVDVLQGFTLYDLAVPRELAAAKKWYAEAEAAQEEKAAQKQAGKTKEKAAEPQAKAPERAGNFVYVEEKDVMTNKLKQFVYGFTSAETIGKAPYVRLGCYDRSESYQLGLTVEWGQPLYDSFNGQAAEPVARITTKFGNNDPLELGWSMSGTRTQTYAPGAGLQLGGGLTAGILGAIVPNATNAQVKFNWDNKIMHQAFWRQPSMALRGYAMSGQEITMIFDTADFRKVAANFRSYCKF